MTVTQNYYSAFSSMLRCKTYTRTMQARISNVFLKNHTIQNSQVPCLPASEHT